MKTLKLTIFSFLMLIGTSAFAAPEKNCFKGECEGDGIWTLRNGLYGREYYTNNSFGKLNSSSSFSTEIEFSQFWFTWFRPYIYFGKNLMKYENDWTSYKESFAYSGFGADLHFSDYVAFTAGTRFGKESFFKDVDSVPTIKKSLVLSYNMGLKFLFYSKDKVRVGAEANVHFAAGPEMDEGAGHSEKFFVGMRFENLTVEPSVFVKTMDFKVAGLKQKTVDTGAMLNFVYHWHDKK